jgi:murein DD-endopeptidase MepM/ murein hydrolase activator NlpD
MVYMQGALRAFLAQQRGHIQLLIIAPIITLSLLGLVVRSASSAVDHRLEKQKVVEQLKRRLSEVQNGPLQKGQLEDELLAASSLSQEEDESGEFSEPAELSVVTSTFTPEPPLSSPQIEAELDLEVTSADSVSSKHQELAPPQPQTFPFETTYRVRKRDTLEAILQAEGVASQDAKIWIAAAKKQKLARKLKIGRQFSFVFSEGDDAPVLSRLTYEIDTLSHLIFEKTADGEITAQTKTLPTTLVWRAVGGRITSSLYKAALRADIPTRIVDAMADMDWHLNFSSDLKSGDTFKVIFEEIQRDGKPVEYGRVLAAEIINKGKSSQVFSLPRAKRKRVAKTRASSASSTVTKGGQRFLRYPVKFTRISSVFTHARFHPVLKKKRPHNGVDFAAPRGTPVHAVANGKVTHAGWTRGFGRIVRIDHPGLYRTEYAHLHKIAKGVKVGTRVKKDQVIGTVGSTGLATGPHLHFGLLKNSKYVNPLGKNLPRTARKGGKKKAPKPDPIRAKMKKTLAQYLAQLEIDAAPTTQVLAAVEPQKTAQATQVKNLAHKGS